MKKYNVTVNGQTYLVEVNEAGAVASTPVAKAAPVAVPAPAAAPAPVAAPAATPAAAPVPAGAQTISAPMPGKILEVRVKAGDAVKRGDVLMILEAMKMKNEIMAPKDAKVTEVRVNVGQSVATGDVMLILG